MQQQKIIIRKFKESDKHLLINLWESIFPDDPPHNTPSKVIEAKLEIDDLIYVAEDERNLVGACMVGYDGHRGWLYAVGVSEKHRRKGVGAALVEHVLKVLKDMGCTKVNLQIRSTNYEVASFYESSGFAREDRLSMGLLIK